MNDKQIVEVMQQTIKPILDLLNSRMKLRVETLNTLQAATLDNAPESVKLMREQEASKVRAVLQEQTDLIEIIKALYPGNA